MGFWAHVTVHWICVIGLLGLSVSCVSLGRQNRLQAAARWRETRMRLELEAYARLDASTAQEISGGMDPRDAQRALARRVCRAVADKSLFTRVTMLLRDPEGRFKCMGSVGVDDLTVAALHRWGEEVGGRGARGRQGDAHGAGRVVQRRAQLRDQSGRMGRVRPGARHLGAERQERTPALAAGTGGADPHRWRGPAA